MADTPVAPRTPEPSLSDTDSLAPADDNVELPRDVERDRSTPPATAAAVAAARDKGKDRARAPLQLLDLPVDILKEIIQQLPHTNDLTSLSLCHSALHRLTVPCIYSRFDIVWPDESTHTEPRSGVDALTYGLATLVMGEECFPHQNRQNTPSHTPSPANTPYPVPRRRFGNYYAQFTKKFSLGNGPAAWVQEYMITKEGGKMLGTLVALAIARMVNLETFVWDMPTGVLRDVWLALSSLAHRTDGEDCRLENLWIRWHDNSIDAPVPPPAPPMILNNVNVPPPPNAGHPSAIAGAAQPSIVVPQHFHTPVIPAIERVEHPTFSVIPPLKSLSVLDIDELPYLDEMSILIARSQKKLRELRVGIAPQAQQRDWVTAWEGDGIQQVDYEASWTGASAIGEKRLGGVLGILVGRVHNLRHSEEKPAPAKSAAASNRMFGLPVKFGLAGAVPVPATAAPDREPDNTTDHFGNPLDEPAVPEGVSLIDEMQSLNIETPASSFDSQDSRTSAPLRHASPPADERDASPDATQAPTQERLTGQLKLEVLELERVPLSVSVLLRAFDWTMLTTLTLLNCTNHEQLWKSLRRTYTPRPAYPNGSPSSSKAYKASYTLRTEYTLNLKKIHTNTVSPSLISFLKETLAPNSLEVLFLQEGRSYQSSVTVDSIYRGPLRRHRASLKKLMIDSSEKQDGLATGSSRWRRWMLNRDILSFVTSGRMGALREVAVAIEYRDWHHLLQRLPLIPHIRSLYIPHLADHPHGSNMDPRELAYQIVDIVHLRPEIELCYMGLAAKCFEILENRPRDYDLRGGEAEGVHGIHGGGTGGGGHGGGGGGGGGHMVPPGNATAYPPDVMTTDDESDGTEDEDDLDDDDDGGLTHLAHAGGGGGIGGGLNEDEETDEEDGFSESDEEGREREVGPKLRVREILFYEERVEAFRRRHGVLRP